MQKLRVCFHKVILLLATLLPVMMLCACTDSEPFEKLTESQDKMNTPEGCISCYFFKHIYNTVGALTNGVYDFMCDFAMSLLAICLFAWILIHVFKLVTSLREPNIAQFWVQLITTLFKGGFVAAFIATKERLLYVIDSILTPISTLIISTGAEILDMNWLSYVSKNAVFTKGISSAPGFSQDIGLQLENLVYRMQIALNGGRILGLRLYEGSNFFKANFWLGLIVTCIFTLLSIFFPFYLIDGLVRIAFVFCMLPILLVCWCFKATSVYLTKAFGMFMGAFLQIMLGCVFVAVAVAVFEGFIQVRDLGYTSHGFAQDVDKLLYADAERLGVL